LRWLAYGNGVFVALAGGGVTLTSTNGAVWATNSSATSADLYSIAYGNGTFVVTGSGCTVLASTNGADWVSHNSGTMLQLFGATFGQDTFILVGDSGAILQSGIMPQPGPPLSPAPGWSNGVFGLNLSAPLGSQWQIQSSTNLRDWTALGTVSGMKTPIVFVDSAATNQQRFYRAVSQ
jgi:hypothetical protein